MAKTSIEWSESVWNPSIGCDKVSAGCKNCYAEVMPKRLQAMGTVGYEEAFKFCPTVCTSRKLSEQIVN